MKYDALHWCFFNFLLRIFGLMAAVIGLVFGLTALIQLRGRGLPTPGISTVGNFLIAIIGVILAIGFLTRRAYRPDLELLSLKEAPVRFGWWTGTPKKKHV